MAPTVTAIVPTYNRPELIGQSIESALAQTYARPRLSWWVTTVARRSPRASSGASTTRGSVTSATPNPSAHRATGSHSPNWPRLRSIASLHDDDTWEPTFLEKTVPLLLEDPSLSMAFTDYWCVDDEGERLIEHTDWLTRHSGRDRLPAGRFDGSYADGLRMVAVQGAPQPAYAAVLRRQAVLDSNFPDEVAPIYDIWLSYQVLRRGEGMYYVPERLTNYRVWHGSLTAAGYGESVDAVLGHVVAENLDAGPVLDEIERSWALDRYRRGWSSLDDPAARADSQAELRRAASGLSGVRWLLAETAARSDIGWHAVRLARSGVRSVRSRAFPHHHGDGVPERFNEPSDGAKRLHS